MGYLRDPTFEFFLPSFHDAIELECRLYLPSKLPSGCNKPKKGAIVAHPYATLGGSFNDPVVSIIGGELVKAGMLVMTFNFRGAGKSKGRTSWTGRPEIDDYTTAAAFVIQYLHLFESDKALASNDPMRIIFAGYSYGSLIASRLPELPDILAPLCTQDFSDAAQKVKDVSADLVKQSLKHFAIPAAQDSTLVAGSVGSSELSQISIKTSYLIVSPLLPPVSTLISLPFGGGPTLEEHMRKFKERPTLAIYGDNDTFTQVSKLHEWASALNNLNPGFQYVQVNGAGHFWREDNTVRSLSKWIAAFAGDGVQDELPE